MGLLTDAPLVALGINGLSLPSANFHLCCRIYKGVSCDLHGASVAESSLMVQRLLGVGNDKEGPRVKFYGDWAGCRTCLQNFVDQMRAFVSTQPEHIVSVQKSFCKRLAREGGRL